ncbi:MAG: CsbD family protein, partial [Hyphomicrobiales bacterium]
MNWDQTKGKWTQFKGKAREQWGDLTNDDLEKAKGNREQLGGRASGRRMVTQDGLTRLRPMPSEPLCLWQVSLLPDVASCIEFCSSGRPTSRARRAR